MKPNAQCPACLQLFYIAHYVPEYYCPNPVCGAKIPPKFFHRKCLITLNWDDLRALTWFSSQWVDENFMGTAERMAFLNIVRTLNSQRDALIAATGSPQEFGHLTPFLEEQEAKKNLKALDKNIPDKSAVDAVNEILMERDEDDDEDSSESGGNALV